MLRRKHAYPIQFTMSNQPFFSVCIPNFNYAHYLEETVQSVLNQSFEDYEIIIVDNASTDSSWELMQSFSDARIKVFRNRSNIGFAPNLQTATEKANGKFIHLLSADDNMKPNVLSLYHDWIQSIESEKRGSLFLFSDVEYIDEKSEVFGFETRNRKRFESIQFGLDSYQANEQVETYSGLEILKRSMPLLKNPAPFLSVVVSSELWQSISGFNAVRTIGPDKFFNYKALFQNPLVAYFPQPLFQYRIHRSANAVAQVTNVKQQIDDYLNVLDFSKQMEACGINREVAIQTFLNRVCFKTGLQALLNKNRRQAWRMLGCMLFFPENAFKSNRFYILFFSILSYPVSAWIGRLAK
jgi:glycosyltransferase involved in cell wall biosynthesis